MVYAGLDYSISCPCICIYDTDTGPFIHKNCIYYFCQENASLKEIERREKLNLDNIFCSYQYKWKETYHRYFSLADFFLSIIFQHSVEHIAMEDYALNASGRVFDIAECTGILKYLMVLSGITFSVFSPTLVKKTFSGKGNANKEQMVNAYLMRYNVSIPHLFEKENHFESPISDIVDSHAMLYTYFNGDKNGTRIFQRS